MRLAMTGLSILLVALLGAVSSGTVCTTNVTVWEGDQALLPCLIGRNYSDVIWCRETQNACLLVFARLGENGAIVKRPWTSDDVELVSNSTLRIKSASFSRDDGKFLCEEKRWSSGVYLSVLQPPKDVNLTGPTDPVRANHPVIYTCHVYGGNPAPILSWYLGDSTKPLTSPVSWSDGRSDVTLTVKKEMNGKSLRCQAAVYDRVVSRTKILEVRYKPTVKVQKRPTHYPVRRKLVLVCQANGNPPPKMAWVFEGTVIADNNNNLNSNKKNLVNNNSEKKRDSDNGNNISKKSDSNNKKTRDSNRKNEENLDSNNSSNNSVSLDNNNSSNNSVSLDNNNSSNSSVSLDNNNSSNNSVSLDNNNSSNNSVSLDNNNSSNNVNNLDRNTNNSNTTSNIFQDVTTEMTTDASNKPASPTVRLKSNGDSESDNVINKNDGNNKNQPVGWYDTGSVLVHKVTNLEGADIRIYTCTAENSEGTASGLLTIDLRVSPRQPHDLPQSMLTIVLPAGAGFCLIVVLVIVSIHKCRCGGRGAGQKTASVGQTALDEHDDGYSYYLHPVSTQRGNVHSVGDAGPPQGARGVNIYEDPDDLMGVEQFKKQKRFCLSYPELMNGKTEVEDHDPYELPFPLAPKRHTY